MNLQNSEIFNVRGKKVLITGGAKGIGLMIATGFVDNGAEVFVSSRSAETCEEVAKQLTARGPGKCYALPDDLSTEQACVNLAKCVSEITDGKLDVLINNSATTWGEPFETHKEKGFDKIWALNVKSIFFLTRACLPMLENSATAEDPSRVINIGSVAGVRPQIFPTYVYDMSKAAIHHLSRKLAIEFAPKHITVNALAPGYFPSKMSDQLKVYSKGEDHLSEMVPLMRKGSPADIAGASIFLSSKAGAYVTGLVLLVDGGWHAKL